MAKPKYPSEEQERFIVRMPEGMRDRLKEAAAANNRSMNAEIVARLEGSLSVTTRLDIFDPAGFDVLALRELSQQVGRLAVEVEALRLNAEAASPPRPDGTPDHDDEPQVRAEGDVRAGSAKHGSTKGAS